MPIPVVPVHVQRGLELLIEPFGPLVEAPAAGQNVSGEPLQAYDTTIGLPELVAPPVAVPPQPQTPARNQNISLAFRPRVQIIGRMIRWND